MFMKSHHLEVFHVMCRKEGIGMNQVLMKLSLIEVGSQGGYWGGAKGPGAGALGTATRQKGGNITCTHRGYRSSREAGRGTYRRPHAGGAGPEAGGGVRG